MFSQVDLGHLIFYRHEWQFTDQDKQYINQDVIIKHCINKLGKSRQKQNPIKTLDGWCKIQHFQQKEFAGVFPNFRDPFVK